MTRWAELLQWVQWHAVEHAERTGDRLLPYALAFVLGIVFTLAVEGRL